MMETTAGIAARVAERIRREKLISRFEARVTAAEGSDHGRSQKDYRI